MKDGKKMNSFETPGLREEPRNRMSYVLPPNGRRQLIPSPFPALDAATQGSTGRFILNPGLNGSPSANVRQDITHKRDP